jgi:hypothetical protein
MKLTTPMQITAADSESRQSLGGLLHLMNQHQQALAK